MVSNPQPSTTTMFTITSHPQVAHAQGFWTLPRAVFSNALQPFQCFTTLPTGKKILISCLSLSWCNLRLFPLLLLPGRRGQPPPHYGQTMSFLSFLRAIPWAISPPKSHLQNHRWEQNLETETKGNPVQPLSLMFFVHPGASNRRGWTQEQLPGKMNIWAALLERSTLYEFRFLNYQMGPGVGLHPAQPERRAGWVFVLCVHVGALSVCDLCISQIHLCMEGVQG